MGGSTLTVHNCIRTYVHGTGVGTLRARRDVEVEATRRGREGPSVVLPAGLPGSPGGGASTRGRGRSNFNYCARWVGAGPPAVWLFWLSRLPSLEYPRRASIVHGLQGTVAASHHLVRCRAAADCPHLAALKRPVAYHAQKTATDRARQRST